MLTGVNAMASIREGVRRSRRRGAGGRVPPRIGIRSGAPNFLI
jgi:hypothetical protein